MARTSSGRPYVICHWVPSIDGRIVTDRWNLSARAHAEYERTAGTFGADAWMIGRISMEPYAGRTRAPSRGPAARRPRPDHIATHARQGFAIALDPSGKLAWTASAIDDEHVVTVLTQRVSDAYLASLRETGVSYLFGGRTRVDLRRVLAKLRRAFGIEKLLLEGGGKINGAFLAADLIDELSILVAPVADGTIAAPSLFDATEQKRPARALKLIAVERLPSDLVWLRYRRR